ncbi:MFS transporter [Nocardioides sp. GXQ0305]|uniref:MFS transporter n=1 Tax=Nocardioides sp. GXQ0305 TaxID=3423912 RepID=UPI003D7DF6AB
MLRLLLGLTLVSTTGRGVFFAVSVLYFTQVVGLSVQGVGLALTLAAGVGVVASSVAGFVADHVPARHLIALTMTVEAGALLVLPWASSLLTFGMLAGLESGMNRGSATARQTLVARAFVGPERTTARARMRVATNLGMGLGSGAAAVVLLDGGVHAFRYAMTAAALTYLVAAVLALRMPVDHVPTARKTGDDRVETPRHRPWRDRRYLGLTCVNGALVTHFAVIEIGLPIWLVTRTEAPVALVSGLLVLNTSLVVLLQVRLNRGFERVDRAGRALLTGGSLLATATIAYAAAAWGGPVVASVVLVLGGVAHGLGEILTSGAGFSLSFELADARAPGAHQGFYGTGQALGMMAGPALVTLVIALGPRGWLLYTLGFAVLGLAGRALARAQ